MTPWMLLAKGDGGECEIMYTQTYTRKGVASELRLTTVTDEHIHGNHDLPTRTERDVCSQQ